MSIKDSDLLRAEAEALRRREEKAAEERKQLARDAQEVFGTPAGERIFWYLMERSGYFAKTLFTGNANTYYLLGRRDMGGELLRLRGLAGQKAVLAAEALARRQQENKG